jgi:hypothetical protein
MKSGRKKELQEPKVGLISKDRILLLCMQRPFGCYFIPGRRRQPITTRCVTLTLTLMGKARWFATRIRLYVTCDETSEKLTTFHVKDDS